MLGFWERVGEFFGRLVFAAAYMALMALVGHLPTTYIVLFCVAIVILDFVCVIEAGEKSRMVFYCLSSALLVGSAAAFHISLMANGGTRDALLSSYFAVCAALSFFIWFEICRVDSVFSYVDLIVYVAGGLLGLLFSTFEAAIVPPVIFLIIGIVFIILVPVFRFKIIGESAFDDMSSSKFDSYSGSGSSGSYGEEASATSERIHDVIDGALISLPGDKYGHVEHVNNSRYGSITIYCRGLCVNGDDRRYAKQVVEAKLRAEGLPIPPISVI